MDAASEAVPAEATDLRELVDGLAVVLWQADARTRRCTFVSAHAERLLGHPASRWLTEPDFLGSLILPEDRAEAAEARWRDDPDRDVFEVEYRAVTARGEVRRLKEKLHVVRHPDGTPKTVRGAVNDVTARHADLERQRFLAVLDRELQRLDDAEELMALATRLLGEHLRVDRCAYARAEADEDHFVMSGDYATGLPPLPGRFAMREFGEGALRAMRAGEPWVVDDSADDPRLGPADLAAYRVTGIRAVICLPLLRGGRFAAAMAVHQATVRHWTPEEVEVVSVVVNRCWESLQRAHADRALRDSEQRHRLLVERATDAIWVLDHELRFVEVNQAACALLGQGRDDLVGRAVGDLVVPGALDRLTRLTADLSAARVVTEVWGLRRPDGTVVEVELSIQATPTGVQAIGRDVTERQRAEAERERLLRREHEIAEALQRSLLPRELPALDRLATSARYLPASTQSRIGGDWYEVLPLGGTSVALSVGDVVGKGPTAAAVMGQLRSALAGYLLDGHSPAAALERLDAFTARVNGAAGSTCACLTFDWSTGGLSWAAAGHLPPLVLDASGSARFLSGGTGAVLGAPGRAPYLDNTTGLEPGASVVLYTDGLVERRGAVIDQGLQRLLDTVRDAHDLPPRALSDAIIGSMLADGQDDDVALVLARHLPPPLRNTVPARPSELAVMRRNVEAWAATAGLSPDQLDDLQLALGEAAANAVDHAYPDDVPGEFTYDLATTATGVRVTVRDHGHWRPEPEDKGYRGRGLQIIRSIAERAVFHRAEDGTTVEFDLAGEPTGAPVAAVREPTSGHTAVTGSADDAPVQVLRLTGDVDLMTVDDLRAALTAGIDSVDPRPVEIDLGQVGYLSSSGIALLLDAAATAHRAHRALTVHAVEGTAPARVLSLSGLHGLTADTLSLRITVDRTESD
ncbi:SpoIIE family protein phosphatase [Saccharothrix texasensis]|uniref:Anti-anti-sigma factor n=1 Tax=Saccharothrix texasensis TaxID=103734 RepID=A0A3N1HGZ6_9PSEU|nr:SpoIIE family protein phosphatase [Saccharothrix texasensis]ROP41744.1 anti-anti-sigma factor [Saccharothrix texasensis]